MSERQHADKTTGKPSEQQSVDAQPQRTDDVKDAKDRLDGDIDSILDEIDEVLEENAEEFVRGFIQKGGQ